MESKYSKWGRRRIQYSYEDSPSLTEQQQAHLTDLNFIVKKYRPDELSAYLIARSSQRVEILGHDFTKEPSLVEAKQIALNAQNEFNNLSDEVRSQFPSPLSFLKFINDPNNLERMHKLGLVTDEQMKAFTPMTSAPVEAPKSDVPNVNAVVDAIKK